LGAIGLGFTKARFAVTKEDTMASLNNQMSGEILELRDLIVAAGVGNQEAMRQLELALPQEVPWINSYR